MARTAVYLCPQIGTPDHDRCNALSAAGFEVIAVEWSEFKVYRWDLPGPARYRSRIFGQRAGVLARMLGALALLGFLLRLRPTVFLGYGYWRPPYFLSAVLCRLLGATVLSLNDSKFDDYLRHWVRDLLKCLLLLPYTGFLAATERAADYLRYLGRRRIRIYCCAIDVARVGRGSRAAYDRTAFEDRYFLAVSRFDPKKNFPLLLDGFELYARAAERPRPLVICGYGGLEAEIRARIAGSELLTRLVTIVGYVTSGDMPERLGGAVALMLPSREEQFGIVAVEAMAAGVPAIVSRTCGVSDLIETGVSGLVVEGRSGAELAWAMAYAGTDEGRWKTMGAAAREAAQRADVSVFVAAVEAFMR